ncbi:hypothetical protein QTP70_019486, partial [Hemibagrus guttatus]
GSELVHGFHHLSSTTSTTSIILILILPATMFRLLSLVLLLSATRLSSSLFLPDSPELQRLLSRYENELETNVTASMSGSRVRRAIPWSDREEILLLHNKLRGGVYPTASNMEYMIWDDELERSATHWAEQCQWEHGPHDLLMSIGQNLAVHWGRYRSPAYHVQTWYDEVKDYTYPYSHECNPWCPERCSGPMCTHYTQERNLEGQMVVDFAKRMDMGVVNTYFQKREEHRVTYKSGSRRTQIDYILCRRGNLKEISNCKVVVGESVARQHRMVVCRMTLMVCKKKRSKIEIEKKTKWWKLKKEEFRQKLRQALGGQVVLPDDWETTAEVIRETGRKVLGVSSERRKEDKETWWWNEEVQDSVQRKRLAKKKWDMDRTEENRQEYKELQRRVKREVSKAKQKAYDELYTRLDTREGEKDLYRLARQRDRDGKDVQQVRVIKDRDGRVLTSEESVQRRWKEYFEELMNEENEREKRVEGVNSVEQKVDKIRKDEVRKALKRMKSGKAVGPDDIPVEVWKCLGEAAVEFLASLFNRDLESERMPEEWRRSVLVPIFKNKGDVQSCSNYRGIKLMSHTMKVWERVVEARLRKVVEICEQQYDFMPRKSTTDAIFALRILMEKYRDGQRELHCVFVDLEKAYDRVPREELWYCMRKSGVAEKYVRVVQDMYERSRTVVRCAVGQTEEFNAEVGLHQGSALSPFLFAIVMDQLSEEVRQESPWTMMFADDIVICSESREQVEENLERWRFVLEKRGMKVSRSKTEYMCVNEREGSGTVRLQGEEVKKVQEFKYLGSTVQSNGECGKEVKKRVQAGWNGWRKVWGVLCDQKISARIKGKVYRTVVRPAMLYGLETVSLRKRQESELEVAELKMLRFSLGVTRLDRIRNEYIRGTAHVGRLGDKVREARLRWFGHVQRRANVSGCLQIVWATTNRVGCAVHVCPSMNVWGERWENAVYLVCNYSPKGNWIGEAPYQHGRPCSQCPPSYGGVCKDNLCYKGAPQRPETPDMNEVEKPQVPVQAEIPVARPKPKPKPSSPKRPTSSKPTQTNFLTQNIKCETKMRDKCKGVTCNRYNCPANCIDSTAKVWGMLYYDVQSSICRAAIHYGVMDNNGGLVEVTRKNSVPFFVKATKNGVESYSKYKTANAFMVAKVEKIFIDCYTRMADICSFGNQPATCPRVQCPADCKNQPSYWAPVIGTGIYADTSSVCRAALHAGVLKASGGYIDILAMDKKNSYTGSLKNGVQSER